LLCGRRHPAGGVPLRCRCRGWGIGAPRQELGVQSTRREDDHPHSYRGKRERHRFRGGRGLDETLGPRRLNHPRGSVTGRVRKGSRS